MEAAAEDDGSGIAAGTGRRNGIAGVGGIGRRNGVAGVGGIGAGALSAGAGRGTAGGGPGEYAGVEGGGTSLPTWAKAGGRSTVGGWSDTPPSGSGGPGSEERRPAPDLANTREPGTRLGGADEALAKTGGVVSTSGGGPAAIPCSYRLRRCLQNTPRMTRAITHSTIATRIGATELAANPTTSNTAATMTKPILTKSSTKSPSVVAGQEKERKKLSAPQRNYVTPPFHGAPAVADAKAISRRLPGVVSVAVFVAAPEPFPERHPSTNGWTRVSGAADPRGVPGARAERIVVADGAA